MGRKKNDMQSRRQRQRDRDRQRERLAIYDRQPNLIKINETMIIEILISFIDSYYRYKNKLKINDNLGFLNKIKRV